MRQKLKYSIQGRCGNIVFKDSKGEINFYFEFGGGNCVVIIFVPSIAEWKVKTKRLLSDRLAILSFVAEQSVKDHTPNCYYEISDNYIEIFSN